MPKKKEPVSVLGEIERMFFGKRAAKLPAYAITKPKKKDYEAWVRHLNFRKNLDTLRLMAAPFVDLLRNYTFCFTEDDGEAVVPSAVQEMLAPGSKSKDKLVNFMALFMEPSNFMIYFDALSPKMQQLWRTTFLKGRLFAKEANAIAGEQVLGKVGSWYGLERSLSPKLQGWFEVGLAKLEGGKSPYSRYTYEGLLSLDQATTKHLIPAIFAEVTGQEQTLKTLPEDSGLLTFCGEDDIFTLLPTIIVLRESKALEQNQNGRMALTSLKAAAKRMGMAEFFPGHCDAATAMIRAQMVLNVVGNAVPTDRRKKRLQDEELVKQAVVSATNVATFILSVVLNEMTGLRASLMTNCNVVEVANAFFSTLCDTANKSWRPFEALVVETMVRESGLNFQLFTSYEFERAHVVNKYTAQEVGYPQVREQITLPLLRGYAFLLAALGLVEIAYREPTVGDVSPYDGLQYVRLTDLGRYCAGRTKKYTLKSFANKQFFEADADQLLIKSLEADNPLKPLVCAMADPITQRLYKVSYGSFLRECTTSDDIDSRIAQFKRYVCAEPTAVWTNFFAEVRRRFKPFTSVSTHYSVVQIPADNKELQRILLTDPVIRKYTIKAEGYLLLIDTVHQAKVKEQLKTYGYLM